MRILCLHGRGTSAAIFKSQTTALRAKLDESYEFSFIDAPFRGTPAAGIDIFYDTVNFTWWPSVTVECIRATHKWLDDYFAEHGPYDAVMCFSQGCSLISSYLMCRAHDAREAGQPVPPPPFKGVMLICGGPAMVILSEVLGLPVSDKARDIDTRSGKALQQKAGRIKELVNNPDLIKPGQGLWDDTTGLMHTPGGPVPEANDVYGIDFTVLPKEVFLDIPSVHVYGAKDPRLPSSLQLAHFFNDRILYDHGGGHDIPRTSAVSVKMAGLLTELGKRMEDKELRA